VRRIGAPDWKADEVVRITMREMVARAAIAILRVVDAIPWVLFLAAAGALRPVPANL
jgi:hypothetical protein